MKLSMIRSTIVTAFVALFLLGASAPGRAASTVANGAQHQAAGPGIPAPPVPKSGIVSEDARIAGPGIPAPPVPKSKSALV
jgi:hypothetical protein